MHRFYGFYSPMDWWRNAYTYTISVPPFHQTCTCIKLALPHLCQQGSSPKTEPGTRKRILIGLVAGCHTKARFWQRCIQLRPQKWPNCTSEIAIQNTNTTAESGIWRSYMTWLLWGLNVGANAWKDNFWSHKACTASGRIKTSTRFLCLVSFGFKGTPNPQTQPSELCLLIHRIAIDFQPSCKLEVVHIKWHDRNKCVQWLIYRIKKICYIQSNILPWSKASQPHDDRPNNLMVIFGFENFLECRSFQPNRF